MIRSDVELFYRCKVFWKEQTVSAKGRKRKRRARPKPKARLEGKPTLVESAWWATVRGITGS